jgi:energy-coupling factor transport system permease protein
MLKLTYVADQRGLHRLHPLTKLAWLFTTLVWTFAFESFALNVAMTAAMLLGLASSGVLRRFLPLWLAVVVPFGISALVIHSLFNPANEVALFAIGDVVIWREGSVAGALFASRVAILSSAVLLFALTTDPRLLMNALIARGFSRGAAYAVLAAMELPPDLQRRTRSIFEAQQARGLDLGRGMIQRGQSFIAILGPLIGGALVATETRTLALEARGFSRSGPRTFLREARATTIDRIAIWVAIVSIPIAIAIRLVTR